MKGEVADAQVPINKRMSTHNLGRAASHCGRGQSAPHRQVTQTHNVRAKPELSKESPTKKNPKKFSYGIFIEKYRRYMERTRAKYKNEKLNLLAQDQAALLRGMAEPTAEPTKYQADIATLIRIFTPLPSSKLVVNRHDSQLCRTVLSKLLFFMGYEVYLMFNEDMEEEEQRWGNLKRYYFLEY
jgi:hypothetical protein